MLTNWVPQSALREFLVRFTAITHLHDRIRCTGNIVEEFERDGEALVRVELQAANQNGDVKLIGEAVIRKPAGGC